MTGRIYLLDESGRLEPMEEEPYEAEVLLQRLLADHPDLLAGEQMNRAEPRRWILVQREARVPDDAESAGRWSLDHLFLDQDGVPTLVEVKRGSDTRARREVVAQMLDYAANATAYWTVGGIRSAFEARCEETGDDPTELLYAAIGDGDADHEVSFWQRVKTNLTAGRIRMVFVADNIATELQRIAEFLNGQMDPAEVLAVEVRQFVGEGRRTLVPRVVGQSAEAQIKKTSSRAARNWDLEMLLDDLMQRKGDRAVAAAERLYEVAVSLFDAVILGGGEFYGTFRPRLRVRDRLHPTYAVSSEGWVDFGVKNVAKHAPFSEPQRLAEFIERMNEIPSVSVPNDLGKWPRTQLSDLGPHVDQFVEVWEWYVGVVRRHDARRGS